MDLRSTEPLRADRSTYVRIGALVCFVVTVALLLVSLLEARPALDQGQGETLTAQTR
jgi:hypothetical protein